MGFHRPAIHPNGLCNFCIAAPLQKQVNNLLLPRTQAYRPCLIHAAPQGCLSFINPSGVANVRRLDELSVNLLLFLQPSSGAGSRFSGNRPERDGNRRALQECGGAICAGLASLSNLAGSEINPC